jgi:hypothetical protein
MSTKIGSASFDALARAFFSRFFDNELTGGSADLRNSFFWLIGFLAAPGAFLPFLMMFNWEGYAAMHGTGALAIAARGDKVLYLGWAMIASGFVSAITWNSLLIDRRDGLVLGVLPVRGGVIVRAKLTALSAYIVLIAIATHAFASVSYGFNLSARGTISWAISGVVAHMVASCAAAVFVLFALASLQGLAFVLAGPRRFPAISPWLQSFVVAALLLSLFVLPIISTSTVQTLAGSDAAHQWILRTPPLWFLGLYEMVLRNADPLLTRLGMFALAGLAGAVILTLLVYPLAYRRVVESVAEMSAPGTRRSVVGPWIERRIVALVGGHPVSRASSQFFLTTVRRSLRHRMAFALSAGVVIAFITPTLFRWAARLDQLPPAPPTDLLALPLAMTAFLLVGLRIAVALPADVDAGWMLGAIGAPSKPMRAGVWRTLFGAIVLPIAATWTIGFWHVWGARAVIHHLCVCLAFGAVAIEALLWGFESFPCSRVWRPERAELRKWWPAYLVGVIFVMRLLPMLERSRPNAWLWIAGVFAGCGAALRLTHRLRRKMPDADLDEPIQVQLLNLGG